MAPSESQPDQGEASKLAGSPGRDLLVVLAVSVATFVFAATVELNEWVFSLTQPLEPYQLDELPLTIVVLVLSMGWFSWRRWVAFSKENELRIAAQQALAALLAENRLLAQKNVVAQEEERRVLARELHDELGQSLNAIKLDAVAIRQRVPEATDEIHQNAAAIVEVVNHVHETIRSLTQRLRPVALDELGLRDALEFYVSQWERRNSPITCTFETSGALDGLGELVNITLYRCVQECLTNITRHARASKVHVKVANESATIQLQVEDDGRGMDLQANRNGVGLIGLRERAESLRGVLELKSEIGRGMTVALYLPLPKTKISS